MIKKIINKVFKPLRMAFLNYTDDKQRTKYREYIKKNYGISIGKYTYGYDINEIAKGSKIGSFCSIATGVKIGQMNHPMKYVSTNPFLYYKDRGFISINKRIDVNIGAVIEDDVWIGSNAVILPNVTVGKGAIIAAGCVVTKNVPPYAIWGGVPGKLLKWRFDEATRERLVQIDWSTWDDNRIKKAITAFYDPIEFIDAYEKGII